MPALLIYVKADYTQAPTIIQLDGVPSEILIFNKSLSICVQEPKFLTFTKLAAGFQSTKLRSSRKMINLVSGSNFILFNAPENRIRSWQISLDQQNTDCFTENDIEVEN